MIYALVLLIIAKRQEARPPLPENPLPLLAPVGAAPPAVNLHPA